MTNAQEPRPPAPGAPLVFVHIPRTGGTTFLYDVLLQHYAPQEVFAVGGNAIPAVCGTYEELLALPADVTRAFRAVSGHMPFGVGSRFGGAEQYCVFVRDPIDRVVSDYAYCAARPANPAHEPATRLSLREFVEGGFSYTHNCLTAFLSNSTWGVKYASEEERFAVAKANLTRCACIGVTERYTESLRLFEALFGWPACEVGMHNRSSSLTPPTAEDRRVIAEHNALDLQLYAYACELFEEQLAMALA